MGARGIDSEVNWGAGPGPSPSLTAAQLATEAPPSVINMRSGLLNLLLLLLALLYVAHNPALAQDDEDEVDDDELEAEDVEEDEDEDADSGSVHPLTDMEGPSPDVLTTYILPELGDDLRVPVGEDVSIILGFINDVKTDSDGGSMKVKAITGSLTSVRNPSAYIQNFTVLAFNPVEIVDAGAEMSFEYLFRVDSGVDLQPSQLALTVFYEGLDEDGAPVDFTSTFFNETVMLHEDNKSFLLVDVIGTYAITLGFFAESALLVQLRDQAAQECRVRVVEKVSLYHRRVEAVFAPPMTRSGPRV